MNQSIQYFVKTTRSVKHFISTTSKNPLETTLTYKIYNYFGATLTQTQFHQMFKLLQLHFCQIDSNHLMLPQLNILSQLYPKSARPYCCSRIVNHKNNINLLFIVCHALPGLKLGTPTTIRTVGIHISPNLSYCKRLALATHMQVATLEEQEQSHKH